MPQYLLSMYQPPGTPAPEVLEPIMRELRTIRQELETAGSWVFSGGLQPPSTATVVRAQGEELLLTDGPFTEAKEFLGGFMVIDVPDLDVALEWAGRYARASTLPIEVRPFHH
jgi:hypothetical protein